MIIVNQDKDEIINFDNTLNICILYDEGEKYPWEIFAGMKAPDDNYRTLGYYKTEERAKEVLQEIIETCQRCNEVSFAGGYGYVQNEVYEMPEE